MTFLWPAALWLLLALPLLVALYFFLLERRRRHAVRFSDAASVRVARGRQSFRRHVPPLLLLLGLFAAIVAVARPEGAITLLSPQRTIIMAIDVSLSMQAADIEPTRLGAAKNAAKAFVAQQPDDVRIGIVSFGGSAALVQAPTRHKEDLIAAIEGLSLQRATALGSGLAFSLAALFPNDHLDEETLLHEVAFKHNPAASLDARNKRPWKTVPPGSDASTAIILLTDGRRTTGPDPVDIANIAAEHGVRVFTVGFGKPSGGLVDIGGRSIFMEFDEATLKSIADITKASYFHAATADDLHKIYDALNARYILERSKTEASALAAGIAALLLLAAAATSLRWFSGIY
jgi:Ca-activated chloride channel family protein